MTALWAARVAAGSATPRSRNAGAVDSVIAASFEQLALLQAGVAATIVDRRTAWSRSVLEQAARRVVRLALDGAAAGSRVHAVGEEGLASRDIAGAIGDYLGVPTRSVAPDEVESHFGWIGRFFGWTSPRRVHEPGSCWTGHPPARPCSRTSPAVPTR